MFGDLLGKSEALFVEMHANGYEGKHQKVLDLFHEARAALTKNNGEFPGVGGRRTGARGGCRSLELAPACALCH